MNFGEQRGEQKNFTDPNKKLNGHDINLYQKNVT